MNYKLQLLLIRNIMYRSWQDLSDNFRTWLYLMFQQLGVLILLTISYLLLSQLLLQSSGFTYLAKKAIAILMCFNLVSMGLFLGFIYPFIMQTQVMNKIFGYKYTPGFSFSVQMLRYCVARTIYFLPIIGFIYIGYIGEPRWASIFIVCNYVIQRNKFVEIVTLQNNFSLLQIFKQNYMLTKNQVKFLSKISLLQILMGTIYYMISYKIFHIALDIVMQYLPLSAAQSELNMGLLNYYLIFIYSFGFLLLYYPVLWCYLVKTQLYYHYKEHLHIDNV